MVGGNDVVEVKAVLVLTVVAPDRFSLGLSRCKWRDFRRRQTQHLHIFERSRMVHDLKRGHQFSTEAYLLRLTPQLGTGQILLVYGDAGIHVCMPVPLLGREARRVLLGNANASIRRAVQRSQRAWVLPDVVGDGGCGWLTDLGGSTELREVAFVAEELVLDGSVSGVSRGDVFLDARNARVGTRDVNPAAVRTGPARPAPRGCKRTC